MTDREVISVVKKYLCEEGLRNISVFLSDDLVARACITRINGQPTLQIQRGNVRENWIEGMLRHEIGMSTIYYAIVFKYCFSSCVLISGSQSIRMSDEFLKTRFVSHFVSRKVYPECFRYSLYSCPQQ